MDNLAYDLMGYPVLVACGIGLSTIGLLTIFTDHKKDTNMTTIDREIVQFLGDAIGDAAKNPSTHITHTTGNTYVLTIPNMGKDGGPLIITVGTNDRIK